MRIGLNLLALLSLLSVPFVTGCPTRACDGDGDGFCAPDDCDDSDPDVSPDAEEICNGIDDNCNGAMSDAEVRDADGDGVGACLDCDDTDPLMQDAQADELCDGIDNDCDGIIPPEEFTDEDGDLAPQCSDCDDQDPDIGPDAEEICDNGIDNNCDKQLYWDDEAGNGETTDDDGDGIAPCAGDCDDLNADVGPGNYEFLTDGLDNDCDGQGDNKPGLSPVQDLEPEMLLLMELECEAHGRTVAFVDFEDGTNGDIVGGTAWDGFELLGGTTGSTDYEYRLNAPETGPYEGSLFARPTSEVDGVTLRFDSPQTMVLWAIVGVTPGSGPQYNADIFWDGINLGGISSIFGTDNPDFTWNFRGLWSFANVAFEEVVIYSPVEGGEFISFDSLYFCE